MQWIHKCLAIKEEGLYCIPGNFYIDPFQAVPVAIITHGHTDHARAGHGQVIATPETIAIMQLRYGKESTEKWLPLPYEAPLPMKQTSIRLIPAGHVLGSAQIAIEHNEHKIIISGDYKRRLDPTCTPFKSETCDVFVTEATFGLPIFKHPPIESELAKLLESLLIFPDFCHLVGVYPLGKCQRIIKTLRMMAYDAPIYLHNSLSKFCTLYENFGIKLGEWRGITDANKQELSGKIALCPPSVLHSRWTRKLGKIRIANATGWMQIRARAKQGRIELPLVISDHADWTELTETIREINPLSLWVTHGQEDGLVYYARQHGYSALPLNLLGFADEGESL